MTQRDRGQRISQRQAIEEKGEGDGARERGMDSCPRGQTIPLEREETDTTHGKMTVYKQKGETPCQDEVFNVNWVC